ncbi:glycosyltransferase family 4 protein [Rubinisphaera margarita]|uniref:glycosyltransferase family 4 protein n=1 Tax=Rubinisphaera margarita TaxID=2909586 RepID=UPI001EE98C1F|nr:glycosyltransferase family 4 protein [Rubinisphaera margarita]MCG6156170.1 glycosyltransferase family 4 protein [Rubinisphaera margarita]
MRIAQVAPLIESVPPRKYGGTERIVSYLTEALVAKGHEVTLFASGDSRTSANLCPVTAEALRLASVPRNPFIQHMIEFEEVVRRQDYFDVIHFHTDYFHFPLARHLRTPHVTTLHNRLDLPDLQDVFNEFREIPVVSISNSHRRPLPQANWVSTVYNGIPLNNHFQDHPGEYLAFLGRFTPDKGPEAAIEIALRTNMPLKMAAKIDASDQDYFDQRIRPHLQHPLIEYIGEVDEQGKYELLRDAYALLFPICWPEPFGMVMTEAMSCGTPVVAFEAGSVPEVMRNGVSGFIVHSIEEAVAAIPQISHLGRRRCRQYFEERFTAEQMAQGYLQAYRQVQQEWTRRRYSSSGDYALDDILDWRSRTNVPPDVALQ